MRIAHLGDSSLVAIPVGQTRRVVCASPAYLKRAGTPRSLAELAGHRCVNFGGLNPAQHEWHFDKEPVAVNTAFASNQIDAALDACVAGWDWGNSCATRCKRCSTPGG